MHGWMYGMACLQRLRALSSEVEHCARTVKFACFDRGGGVRCQVACKQAQLRYCNTVFMALHMGRYLLSGLGTPPKQDRAMPLVGIDTFRLFFGFGLGIVSGLYLGVHVWTPFLGTYS